MSQAKGFYGVVSAFDERLYRYFVTPNLHGNKHKFLAMNSFDQAHVVMLARQGIIATSEASQLLQILARMAEMGPEQFPWNDRLDIFSNRESFIIKQVGENLGGKVHTGRSRSDVSGVADRMVLREHLLAAIEVLLSLVESSLRVCEAHIDTVMPSYTQLQHAQPTTFAHYLLSFIFPLSRDAERLLACFDRTNLSPAGAAILAGTSFPLDRGLVADLLGFSGLCVNTRDATMNYDYALETLSAVAILMCDLARLTEDLDIWCTSEFKMIDLPDNMCGTSSIMPQKRNPYPLQVIRGSAGVVIGRLAGAFATLKAPSEEVIDFYMVADEMPAVMALAAGCVDLMEGVLSGLKVHRERMSELASAYWAQATDLADLLVKEKGLAFRTAHHIIAQVVREAQLNGLHPTGVTAEMFDRAAESITGAPLGIAEDTLRRAADPSEGVRGRLVAGGPSAERVQEQILTCQENLTAYRSRMSVFRDALARAGEHLLTAMSEITGDGAKEADSANGGRGKRKSSLA